MLRRRRFWGNWKYFLFLWDRQIIHGNYQVPIEDELQKGIKVLHSRCHQGNWVTEMARDYPRSHFIGAHVSRVSPSSSGLPNCSFVQADIVKGLPFPDNTFDYVYQRYRQGDPFQTIFGNLLPFLLILFDPCSLLGFLVCFSLKRIGVV